jgi:hypothetical protein
MGPATFLTPVGGAPERRVNGNRSNNILYRSVGMAEGEIGPKTFFAAALEQPEGEMGPATFLTPVGGAPKRCVKGNRSKNVFYSGGGRLRK